MVLIIRTILQRQQDLDPQETHVVEANSKLFTRQLRHWPNRLRPPLHLFSMTTQSHNST